MTSTDNDLIPELGWKLIAARGDQQRRAEIIGEVLRAHPEHNQTFLVSSILGELLELFDTVLAVHPQRDKVMKVIRQQSRTGSAFRKDS